MSGLVVTFLGMCLVACVYLINKEDSFEQMLKENNTTVVGPTIRMSRFQIEGLLGEIKDNENVRNKYLKRIDEEGRIELTPTELLEIDFWTRNLFGQKWFLERIKNQEVQIDQKEDGTAYIIAYNVDNE